MIKKLSCLIVFFVLIFCFASAEEILDDVLKLHGYTDGVLNFDSIYLDPLDGPGYAYYPVSVSLPKGTVVHVLTQVMDSQGNRWVLAESDKIRAYFLQQDNQGRILIDCDLSMVPAEQTEFDSISCCLLYTECQLLYGPDPSYQASMFTADTDGFGYVVLMNGDWALVEFCAEYDSASWLPEGRKTRGWIPFSNLVY